MDSVCDFLIGRHIRALCFLYCPKMIIEYKIQLEKDERAEGRFAGDILSAQSILTKSLT